MRRRHDHQDPGERGQWNGGGPPAEEQGVSSRVRAWAIPASQRDTDRTPPAMGQAESTPALPVANHEAEPPRNGLGEDRPGPAAALGARVRIDEPEARLALA